MGSRAPQDVLQAAFLLQTSLQVLALGSLRKAWRFGGSMMQRMELILAPRSHRLRCL